MPSQTHHCDAARKSGGCNGQVVSGQNCPKCKGYSGCEGGCGRFVNEAGKTCAGCKAKVAGDAKRAKEAEKKKKKKGKRELESRDFNDLQLAAREPEAEFMGESLVVRGLDFEEAKIFARGLDAHVHPPTRPLDLTSDGSASIGAMPHKTSGTSTFFFGVAATLSIVMVYGLWRRFRQKQQ